MKAFRLQPTEEEKNMIRLPAAFAVLFAASLLSGCQHRYQTYEDAYVTEYEEDDVFWSGDETYVSSSSDDYVYEAEEDGTWQYSDSVVIEPVQDDYSSSYSSYSVEPQYNSYSAAYVPASVYSVRPYAAPLPRPRYVPPPAVRLSPPRRFAAPGLRPSSAIRTPPPVLIWPVRICPY
jgi:hypothetical protein